MNAFSWVSPLVEIRDTNKYGKGIFAKARISQGTVLMVMGGYILNTEDENSLGDFATNYNMDFSEEWSYCPRTESDLLLMPQHLINHSCNPNSGFLNAHMIVAIVDINKDEEITYDYAFVMYSHPDSLLHYELICKCGAPDCRKKIHESDWQIKDIQNKYGKFFQPFLRDKFNDGR